MKNEAIQLLPSNEEIIAGASTGQRWILEDGLICVYSPVNGKLLGRVAPAGEEGYRAVMQAAADAFEIWRRTPAPKRGEIVRQYAQKLRAHKRALGELISMEMGKILQEGMGEVQEMIDVADFAVGLSRQLYGLTIASERPGHRMMEQYHPLGPVAVISAYNFPVSVWSWNAMIAAVCGDTVVWKPSEKTPLTAVACQRLMGETLRENDLPEGVFNLLVGGGALGKRLADDARAKLVSFTGSTAVGRQVGQAVAARMGRTILELGGNNAAIVAPSADLSLVIPAVVFGAAGTAGQRCTTLRRLIVHESVIDRVAKALTDAYGRLNVGDPLQPGTHVGPMIDASAAQRTQDIVARALREGGELLVGGERVASLQTECYVRPAIVRMPKQTPVVLEENFCPILYLISYTGDVAQAIAMQNAASHGLSSSIFTNDLRESERFLCESGSDCGIANVNIGTSGAEIGGAFGGEKETGGGRESGSDAWKAYMRRQTCTVNYANDLPLSQGIDFHV